MTNILVENITSLIKYQGGDFILNDKNVYQISNDIIVRIIGDLNKNNSSIYSIEEISDFKGDKYLYKDGSIIENPNYVDPSTINQSEV